MITANTPDCSDFRTHSGVEDLTLPHRWQRHACKAAQRRRTCPDLREKSVMVKIRNRAGQAGNHVASFPQRVAHLNDCLTKFAKGLPRLPPSVPRMGANESLHFHIGTWLTGHVLRSASTLLTYKIPDSKSKDLDQCHIITCDCSKHARLFRL